MSCGELWVVSLPFWEESKLQISKPNGESGNSSKIQRVSTVNLKKSWSEFCVNSVALKWLPTSSGILSGYSRSSGVSCVDALPARPPGWSGAGGGKKEISKLEGVFKMRYKNLNFPTTNEF